MAGVFDWAGDALRAAEDTRNRVEEAFEPRIRLGVTGLSRAGKTVFITALIANLLNRGRMTQLDAAAEGRILSAALRPQPDPAVSRFDYEEHLAALTARAPAWPESTRAISELRVSLRYRPAGMLSGLSHALTGPSTLHLDIVDYPGEWLLDLPLLDLDYPRWATMETEAAKRPVRLAHSADWRGWSSALDPDGPADEALAREAAARFGTYLNACRDAGLSAVGPGQFLMPGDRQAGSPAVTFAPLPRLSPRPGRDSLQALMTRNFEAYKSRIVKPFFKDHFSKIDRQIVLVDLLAALNTGPAAVADLRQAMAAILGCFRPGLNSWLSVLTGRRVERILFAATKADHIHHTQHSRLTAALDALLRQSREAATYHGAMVEAMAIAALRATVEVDKPSNGDLLHCVRGRSMDGGRMATLYPGELPDNPLEIAAAADRADRDPAWDGASWLDGEYGFMRFAPPRLTWREGEGPPHIRLDRALNFLIGDRLA